ncbi:peptidoglycan-binding domain-containing protein [Archangium primigenium]|uniref:peptidoglycan-binding domain-containing protein n=1 Tax=[Archangium] primigenium TaxID=2792470 RepID=UPI001957E35A|nr:peptidoglycan-binding domain-containing protein [Archangium primigenium]MBM7112131.1 peptidoglycan-binding protein [Archangium primigenium]
MNVSGSSRSSGSSSTSRSSGTSSTPRTTSTPSTPRTASTTPAGFSGTSSFSRTATAPRTAATSSTARSSFAAAPASGSLKPGMSGPAVRSLQDKLRTAGFNPGTSDGKYGPRTESAVRDFQRSRGLQVDGIAGRRTMAALNGAGGTSGTTPGAPAGSPANGTARLNNQPAGKGMTTGTITVNGRSYQFNSGSRNLFSTPQGTYRVTAHRNSRSEAAFTRDGVGFSFRLEDARRPNSDAMYDPRAGRDRTALRIHPDGGATGTAGCIGVVGDAQTMRNFRDDMNAELRRNGGSYTLTVR